MSPLVRALVARWYFAVAGALLGIAVALALSATVTPQFRAESKLWISVSGDAQASALDLAQGASAAQQRIHSYVDLVGQPIVLQPVIDELDLPMSTAELARSVTATSPTGSVVMQIAVTSPDRAGVSRITDSIVRSFSTVVQDRLDDNASGGVHVTVTQTSPAATPVQPIAPRTTANAALGAAVGVGLGVVAAFLRWSLDTKVRDRDEIQELWDLPVLGDIGFDPEAAKQPLVLQSERASARAEAFRSLRTNVQFLAAQPQGARTIAVTSSCPAEGKTTTTANLAIALAESGLRTVVIDADLRRPNLASVLGVEGAVGLSDLLVGRVELDDVMQPWGRNELQVIPSGTVPPNPSELIGSSAFTALIDDVSSRADAVIVDTPPLGSVTDAALVSRAVGNMLLVVASGKVHRAEVSSSIEALATVGASVQGVVVTMARSRGGRDAYAVYQNEPESRKHRRLGRRRPGRPTPGSSS